MRSRLLIVGALLFVACVAACTSEAYQADDGASGGGSSSSSGESSGGGSSSGPPPPPPTHTDGIKNLDETDVDCGGAEAPKCADAKGCAAATDCTSKVCTGDKCQIPTSTDGVQNGDETDLDCGGKTTGAPRCTAGKTCATHGDCASKGCAYDKKCADGKSCTEHHGGDTCGPAATQESCCKAIDVPLPSGTIKLDKYAITAGRFRAFVERENGNIRAYIKAHKPSWWEDIWDDLVPTQLDDGTYISHDGVAQEVGPGLFFAAAGGNKGCEIESYGARTYRLDDAVNTKNFSEKQHYAKDDLDEKAMQCATFFMFSAFCAWDGGRLPTVAEMNYAWNQGTPANYMYPWGNSPVPAGWNDSWNDLTEAQTYGTKTPSNGDQTYASFDYNWWSPAARVCAGNMSWCDYSVHVAPPGRFPKGNGPYGHADLGGNVFNITSEISGTPGTAVDTRKVVWFRNGSWQGHAIPFYSATTPTPSSYISLSKYWATGARCAR